MESIAMRVGDKNVSSAIFIALCQAEMLTGTIYYMSLACRGQGPNLRPALSKSASQHWANEGDIYQNGVEQIL